MAWIAPGIDWLGLRTREDLMGAIRALVKSNPVVQGSVHRPTAYRDQTTLYQAVNAVAEGELAKALRDRQPYARSQEIQRQLMSEITRKLIREHRSYQLTQYGSQPATCKIYRAQVWWPASFYIVRGVSIFDSRSAQTDFYETDIAGKRHPAIVTAITKSGLYWMVPCSHSGGGGTVKVILRAGDQGYAKCGFTFLASWTMLCGDPHAPDWEGRRVTAGELVDILRKIREVVRSRRQPSEPST